MPYIAPEILRSRSDQTTINSDMSSDIYSFGMVMWEVSTTYQPFEERQYNLELSAEIKRLETTSSHEWNSAKIIKTNGKMLECKCVRTTKYQRNSR